MRGHCFQTQIQHHFMGKAIELLMYNFSGEDYRNIEGIATKSLKIVYRKLYKSLFIYLFALKLIIVSFKKEGKRRRRRRRGRRSGGMPI